MEKTINQMLIIFGASGDLTARKLIPALYNLYKNKHIPENFVVLGASRSAMTDAAFRKKVVQDSKYLEEKIGNEDKSFIAKFSDKLHYEDIGSDYDTDYSALAKRIKDLNKKEGTDDNFIFYLSTPPVFTRPLQKSF